MNIPWIVKLFVSAGLITLASEIAKRSSFMAALTLALPLSSILGLSWVALESGDLEKVRQLSREILILVPPSLIFFPALNLLIARAWSFGSSLAMACFLTFITYQMYMLILKKWF